MMEERLSLVIRQQMLLMLPNGSNQESLREDRVLMMQLGSKALMQRSNQQWSQGYKTSSKTSMQDTTRLSMMQQTIVISTFSSQTPLVRN